MQDQFEDLIIDNSGKKNKQKALLFKVILFVVVVLVVALGFKITGSSSSTTPAEPKADLLSKDNSGSQFEPLKAQVEDVHDDDFGSLSERLSAENDVPISEPAKPSPEASVAAATVAKPAPVAPAPASITSTAVAKPTPKPVSPAVPVAAVKPAPKPVVPVVPVPKPAAAVKPAPKPSPERSVFDSLNLPEVKQLPAIKPTSVAPVVSTNENGYYVQVYAGKKLDLNSHEIKLLDSLNLKYQVVKAGNLERVIVGPYSQDQREQALRFIRAKVKKDAFFYRKK